MVSVGHHHRVDRQAAARRPGPGPAGGAARPRRSAWPAHGWSSRRLRRQTHGLGEGEITRMYEYYTAVLGAVREGLVLLDADGRVQLVNDEAHPAARPARPTWSAGRSPTSAWRPGSSRPRSADRRGRRHLPRGRPGAGGQLLAGPLAGPGRRCRGDPARPHRAAGRHRRARRRPRAQRVAARADPRVGQPAPHRGVAHRDGPGRGGGRVRHRGAAAGPAARRPGRRRGGDPVRRGAAARQVGGRRGAGHRAARSRASSPTSRSPRATW